MIGRDTLGKDRPQSSNDDLCDNLIGHITKTNKSKVIHSLWVIILGDKSNIGVVDGVERKIVQKEIPNQMNEKVLSLNPVLMEKNCM